ncbi:hypothetical protein CC79DRAFT_866220 [Sarocladium strictum]
MGYLTITPHMQDVCTSTVLWSWTLQYLQLPPGTRSPLAHQPIARPSKPEGGKSMLFADKKARCECADVACEELPQTCSKSWFLLPPGFSTQDFITPSLLDRAYPVSPSTAGQPDSCPSSSPESACSSSIAPGLLRFFLLGVPWSPRRYYSIASLSIPPRRQGPQRLRLPGSVGA